MNYELFKVFLKTIHIRTKRHNPVGFKCFLYKLTLIA